MRTVYLDSEFRCHVQNDGTMTAVETDAFDGKCDDFVESCRLVPERMSWTREDGTVFTGPMRSCLKDYRILEAAQKQYEKNVAQLADMEAAMAIMFEGEEV